MSEKTLWVCGCGWQNNTTYRGLRIHQGKSKCGFLGVEQPSRGSWGQQEIILPQLIQTSNSSPPRPIINTAQLHPTRTPLRLGASTNSGMASGSSSISAVPQNIRPLGNFSNTTIDADSASIPDNSHTPTTYPVLSTISSNSQNTLTTASMDTSDNPQNIRSLGTSSSSTMSPGSPNRSATPSLASPKETPVNILKHLNCSICMDILVEPVTTVCGHTFCKRCLNQHLNNNSVCPLCNKRLSSLPEVNIILKDIVKDFQKAQLKRPEQPTPDQFTGQPDEFGCDACSNNQRKKAEKFCLMCSMSYCTEHLEKHQKESRLKGHQLVAPQSEMDQWVCQTHGRPLELYSLNENRCICSLCVQEGMKVVPVEKERDRKQRTLDADINDRNQKVQQKEKKIKEFDCSAINCLDLINKEKVEIRKVFDAIMRAVKKAEEEALRPLEDRRRQVETEVKDFKEELKRELAMILKDINEIQQISNEENPILFLQKFSSIKTSNNTKDWTTVTLDTALTFGAMTNTRVRMMAEIEAELEKLCRIEILRIKKFAVDVTLAPDTANAQLLISEDLREVRGREQNAAGSSAGAQGLHRFDLFCSVLAQNRLTEGRAFWVVDVGNKQGWDIGVVQDKANRKGQISFKPSQGYWAIVHYDNDHYVAMEDPPTLLSLPAKPRKVGVFVDYQQQVVSFYDMEAKKHIYSFTGCVFGDVIRPYVSPHANNLQPLIICPAHPQTSHPDAANWTAEGHG